MGILEVAALAVALGADCFSVSVGIGMDTTRPRAVLVLPALFGATQGVLVTGGYYAAALLHWFVDRFSLSRGRIGDLAQAIDPAEFHQGIHLVLSLMGAAVLISLGVNLIHGFLSRRRAADAPLYHGKLGLLALALTVNVDAVTAGIGLGMMDGVAVPLVTALMATVGVLLTGLGLKAGRRLGDQVGKWAQPVGGAILVVVAARVVWLTLAG